MSKKVKCINCGYSSHFYIPTAKALIDSPYTLNFVKNYIVCDYTMKTKKNNHQQYCKHYCLEGEFHKREHEMHIKEVEQVEKEMGKIE